MVMWSPGRFFWHQLIRKLGLNIQSFWICSSNFAHSDYINKCREWLAPPPRSYFIQGCDSQTHHNSREGIFLSPSPCSGQTSPSFWPPDWNWIDFNFLEFNKICRVTVCLHVFVSDSSGVISLSLSLSLISVGCSVRLLDVKTDLIHRYLPTFLSTVYIYMINKTW